MQTFDQWWYEIGSGITREWDHDDEEHAEKVAREAWNASKRQEERLTSGSSEPQK